MLGIVAFSTCRLPTGNDIENGFHWDHSHIHVFSHFFFAYLFGLLLTLFQTDWSHTVCGHRKVYKCRKFLKSSHNMLHRGFNIFFNYLWNCFSPANELNYFLLFAHFWIVWNYFDIISENNYVIVKLNATWIWIGKIYFNNIQL